MIVYHLHTICIMHVTKVFSCTNFLMWAWKMCKRAAEQKRKTRLDAGGTLCTKSSVLPTRIPPWRSSRSRERCEKMYKLGRPNAGSHYLPNGVLASRRYVCGVRFRDSPLHNIIKHHHHQHHQLPPAVTNGNTVRSEPKLLCKFVGRFYAIGKNTASQLSLYDKKTRIAFAMWRILCLEDESAPKTWVRHSIANNQNVFISNMYKVCKDKNCNCNICTKIWIYRVIFCFSRKQCLIANEIDLTVDESDFHTLNTWRDNVTDTICEDWGQRWRSDVQTGRCHSIGQLQ